MVKVSSSRKEILVSSIHPQNALENVNLCSSLLGQKFFVRFLEELKKNKKTLSKLTDLLVSLSCHVSIDYQRFEKSDKAVSKSRSECKNSNKQNNSKTSFVVGVLIIAVKNGM